MSLRVLLLSWEYPPVIEGGLARHVRKLAEALVRQGVEVHVLTRGLGMAGANGAASAGSVGGVHVHRVPEPSWPRELDRFVAWVERMNEDMLSAGEALAEECSFDLIHGHDWLVASACGDARRPAGRAVCDDDPRDRARAPSGRVQDQPQAHIHSVERWMAHRADSLIVCSHYMRGHVADIFDVDEHRITVIPNGIDPAELRPVGDLEALRGEFAAPDEKLVLLVGRLVYEKGFQLALDALPGGDRAGRERALPGCRERHARGGAARAGAAARARWPRELSRMDRG